MAVKLGGGGNSLQEYDSKGKYTEGSSSGQSYNIKTKIKPYLNLELNDEETTVETIENLPRYHNGKKRESWDDLSDSEKEYYYDTYFNQYGKQMQEIQEASLIPTSDITEPERLQMRKDWIDEEIGKQIFESDIPKRKEHKAYIVLGQPASGKSTISKDIMDNNGAFVVDADNMKEYIPEFHDRKTNEYYKENVSKVHKESVDLSNEMLDKLITDGSNLVIGKVGGSSQLELLKKLVANGYKDVYVCYVDVPMQVSIERNIDRYEKGRTNRLINFDTITWSEGKIEKTFLELINKKEVKGGVVYSNDVPYGSPMEKIGEYKDIKGM